MSAAGTDQSTAERRDRTHDLDVVVVLGLAVGILAPGVGQALRPLGTGFVDLIEMVTSPVMSCTIVLGIGSIRQAAKIGEIGGMALLSLIAMSTVALVIGLILATCSSSRRGSGDHRSGRAGRYGRGRRRGGTQSPTEFLLGVIPDHARVAHRRGVRSPEPFRGASVGFAVQAQARTSVSGLARTSVCRPPF